MKSKTYLDSGRHSHAPYHKRRAGAFHITFHPDFTCLNKRTRQEFIWEHFGMMDNPNYAEKAVDRTRVYANAGYIPEINLITSTESTDLPLNIQYVEQIVNKILK